MMSGPQSYMESNSASNWYSFQCYLQCRIQLQTGVEFCWVTQHLRKQICSTLLCTIYCLNYFAKMFYSPTWKVSASNCSKQCRIALEWIFAKMLSYSHLTFRNCIVVELLLIFIPMQFAMQNSDWRRILLSDSTPPKADLLSTLLCTIYLAN